MSNNYVRGSGPLDNFLAKLRAGKANSFIKEENRKGRILDFGCGSYPYFLISTEFKEKYGIDPSLRKKNIKGIILTKAKTDNKTIPYEDNFFDVITMLAVFEHLEEESLNQVLKEIKRVLKKNGVFIMTTPSPWSDIVLHWMARTGLISKEEIHDHKHHNSKSKIVKILKNAGFRTKNIKSGYFELGFNMWFVVHK